MSPWCFSVYMDAVMVKLEMGRKEIRFQEVGREWRLLSLLYLDDLVLCGELEEDLRAMVGHFIEVCRRKGLKGGEDMFRVCLRILLLRIGFG